MGEKVYYDVAERERLRKMDYEQLVKAPGQPNGRLREARFVMQAKVALETRELTRRTVWGTIVMAFATIVQVMVAFR
jgi:hypothetical protein